MCAVIVPPAGWYWQSCDCLLDPGRHFFTTAEEKSNCCCNSDQGKPAKLHGEVLNDVLTPDSRILDFSPMGSGTVKTNRWLYPNQSLDLFRDNTSIISAAGVSYVGSRVDFILGFPAGDFLGIPNSYFGPNFQFTTTATTPDSGSTFLLLLGSAGALIASRGLLGKRVTGQGSF